VKFEAGIRYAAVHPIVGLNKVGRRSGD